MGHRWRQCRWKGSRLVRLAMQARQLCNRVWKGGRGWGGRELSAQEAHWQDMAGGFCVLASVDFSISAVNVFFMLSTGCQEDQGQCSGSNTGGTAHDMLLSRR